MTVSSRRWSNTLTEGSLFGAITRLAGPLLVGSLLSNTQSIIDLFWVGRLGSEAVAALAMSGTVMMLLFPVIMGMATGTIALVSRFVGAGDPDQASQAAGQSMGMALILGLACGAAGWLAAPMLCTLLGAAPAVHTLAVEYLRVSFAGAFAVFLLFVGNSVMQGAGNTVLPTCAMALANLTNLVLDPLLIFGLAGLPRLGVRGAALATVLSHCLAAVLVLTLLARGSSRVKMHAAHCLPHVRMAWRIARIGLPGMGQMLARSLMSLVLMRIVAASGMMAVAAYGIGLRFHMISLMPAFALGSSAATLVGQNLGARLPDRAAKAALLAAAIGAVILSMAALVLIVFAPALIRFFDRTPEVLAIGTTYLRIVSPFYIFSAAAIILGRGLMGAGDTVSTMIIQTLCLWGLQVPMALWWSRLFAHPTLGIWWAMAAAAVAHGVLIFAWFQRGRWKYRKV